MIALIFAGACLLLALGYIFYGRFLEKQYNIDSCRLTPAHYLRDDIDYIPTEPPILFGHHFSSIAGAVPIVGPIIAASAFGWLPPLLWLVFGAIFIGGVHDFSALVASIRHKARSIAELSRLYLSTTTYKLFLIFIWVALVYILIVFVDMTATTFAPPTGAIADINVKNEITRNGGVVATASVGYIILAIIFGLLIRLKKINLKTGTKIFVPLVFATLWLAEYIPITSDIMPAVFGDSKNTWTILLILYCFTASLLPVWLLLQPRDYLSSFLLFGCVAVGGVGMVIASITGKVSLEYPAFITFEDRTLGFIFPALFITVACGAVSGFHSIVASGTTAKQLPRECAAKPVAYGSMLVETALALVALGSIMMAAKPQATPQITFAGGMGTFLSMFGLPQSVGVTFALLAISTFLLTTLDT
ncbi:MAG: carbon starvation CstA family protein, partial [Armatimonadota bacterium]